MTRVLVAADAAPLADGLVRRLLRDPAFDVRVATARPVPQWMREGSQLHSGELRDPLQARLALEGCATMVLLSDDGGEPAGFASLERCVALLRAALDTGVERVVLVSSTAVYERAVEFPTTEAHLEDCPPPRAAHARVQLAAEACWRAAHAEHGLPFTICRPSDVYGPGLDNLLAMPRSAAEGAQTRTPTHVDDVADGIVAALASPAGLNEDFNISAGEELTAADLTRIVGEACGVDDAGQADGAAADPHRNWPSVEKARTMLGWEARIPVREGIAQTVAWLRALDPARAGH